MSSTAVNNGLRVAGVSVYRKPGRDVWARV